jgi:dihydrofolate reductase
MAAHWTTAKGAVADFMNSIPKIVFSRTLAKADWNNTRLVRENAEGEIAKLKSVPGRSLFVFGSANLSATLMQHNLFDEYRLCVVPVVLGAGTPLFKPGGERRSNEVDGDARAELRRCHPVLQAGTNLRAGPTASEREAKAA